MYVYVCIDIYTEICYIFLDKLRFWGYLTSQASIKTLRQVCNAMQHRQFAVRSFSSVLATKSPPIFLGLVSCDSLNTHTFPHLSGAPLRQPMDYCLPARVVSWSLVFLEISFGLGKQQALGLLTDYGSTLVLLTGIRSAPSMLSINWRMEVNKKYAVMLQ